MTFTTDNKSQRAVMIGCDCGAIVHATLLPRVQAIGNECRLRMNWSADALQILYGVPLPHQPKLVSIIEERAQSKKRSKINCGVFYETKPPLDVIYPSILQCICRPHNEKITTLQTSFDYTLYFSCGLDGKLYLFSTENNSLITEIDPSKFLTDTKAHSLRDARFVGLKVILNFFRIMHGILIESNADYLVGVFIWHSLFVGYSDW